MSQRKGSSAREKPLLQVRGDSARAHDSCVLDDALSRPRGFDIPEGKFYIGDAEGLSHPLWYNIFYSCFLFLWMV